MESCSEGVGREDGEGVGIDGLRYSHHAIVSVYLGIGRRETMKEKHVRVYDFETKQISEIPAKELAPGMVRANVEGIDGEVWVDAAQGKTDSGYRHPPFGRERKMLINELIFALHDVLPKSEEEWEDGFRNDAHPDREIALWIHVAGTYNRITANRHDLTHPQKQQILVLLVQCTTAEESRADETLQTVDLGVISEEQAREAIVRFYHY